MDRLTFLHNRCMTDMGPTSMDHWQQSDQAAAQPERLITVIYKNVNSWPAFLRKPRATAFQQKSTVKARLSPKLPFYIDRFRSVPRKAEPRNTMPSSSSSSSSPPSTSADAETDGFDRIPDHVVLLIFNLVSDLRTLARCRSVSKRFRSLVPHSDTLLLRVDSVISPQSKGSFLLHILRSIFSSFHRIVSPKPPIRQRQSPSEILRCYHSIRNLEIELPSGDLKLEKGTILKWKAKFGKSLRYCVILGVRGVSDAAAGVDDREFDDVDFYGDRGGLKLRVVWTISALIAASVRHYLVRDVIRERNEMERLVVRDRDGEGAVAMDERGLRELREAEQEEEAEVGGGEGEDRRKRTTVPAVRMRMRHAASVELAGGGRMRGATLVVVWAEGEREEEEMEGFVKAAFGGVYGEAVEALVTRRSYVLEMNSF